MSETPGEFERQMEQHANARIDSARHAAAVAAERQAPTPQSVCKQLLVRISQALEHGDIANAALLVSAYATMRGNS